MLLAALLFSTGGVAIKLSTLTGWQAAGLRTAIGALALLALPAARRGYSWRTLVVAIPYAATFILYALANKQTTAANAIFLQDTAPLYVLLLAPLVLGERIERADVIFLLALAGGAALLLIGAPVSLATAPNPRLGNALALAAGGTWALSLLGLRWISLRSAGSGEQPFAIIVAGCVLAAAVAATAQIPAPPFPSSARTLANLGVVIYLGVVQIGLAYVLLLRGIRGVSALEASLLLLVEPVFTPLWAWLLLDERPPALGLLGGAMIVLAVAANGILRGVSSAPRTPRSA